MTITNVSTYSSLQTLLQNMGQVETDLNTAQEQVSSGEASQTYQGLSGNVQQYVSLNAQISQLTDFNSNNSVIVSQLQTSNTTLGQIIQIATNVQSLVASQLSGTSASQSSFQQQLQDVQNSLTSELNTTFEGNYLYGGTDTNTPPVASPLPAAITIGTPDNSYYQGSAQDSTLRIGSDQTITNNVRADNPAFQQIFAGIAQALSTIASTGTVTTGSSSGSNSAALQSAENLIATGIQGVTALQATVNANIVTVQQAETQSQTVQTYFKGVTSGISQADVVALSAQIAQDQTVLEASFEAFSRISSLTLANYLK
jgi:flagellar hook-associated protein 3 FlgL